MLVNVTSIVPSVEVVNVFVTDPLTGQRARKRHRRHRAGEELRRWIADAQDHPDRLRQVPRIANLDAVNARLEVALQLRLEPAAR